jgi:alpha-L-arabinofuranosidase
MKRMVACLLVCGSLLAAATLSRGETQITVDVGKPGAKISPAMWGIFFEDINFGADGGLYAEMVKNRSFEFSDASKGWTEIQPRDTDGLFEIRDANPLNASNPHYLRLAVKKPGSGYGVANEGFRGVGVRKGDKYYFSVYARSMGSPMGLKIQIVGGRGNRTLAEGTIANIGEGWKNYNVPITATDTEPKAKLNVLVTTAGVVDLDMVSLFPEDSAAKSGTDPRPIPGLRKDLVTLLADLKPGFMRFPGGCIVEGRDIDTRYQWKNTIGDINQRKSLINRWNDELPARPAPDYFQSFGLGFYEFFTLCEQIGAEPLPILNCGMACQYNTAQLVPMDQIEPYVQDALDLIEFANGAADSTWGKKRVEMGHPAPFNLKMMGVGNEQWGPQYIERYKVFAKAIKDKYPDVKLIGATGGDSASFPTGFDGAKEVQFLQTQLRGLNADFVDEHFYRLPEWFEDNTNHYDAYERKGPKVFVGEYAAQSKGVASPDNRNNWECALAEAAFMTGFERNADLIAMTSYAPLFAHEDAWQWVPNLIWFDNLQSYGSTSYYIQQAFSRNRGDKVLSAQVANPPVRLGKKTALFASASLDESGKEVILKIVNIVSEATQATISLQGAAKVGPNASVTVLNSGNLAERNSIAEPKSVAPVSGTEKIDTPTFKYSLKPSSMTVLRIPLS